MVAAEVQQFRVGGRQEWSVRGGGDLRNSLQQLHVFRTLAELVVADDGGKWSAAEDAEFLFVDLLEECALVELGCALQVLEQLALGDVEHLDLQHVAGFGLVKQIFQSAPCAFELLEGGIVQDFIELQRDEVVDLRDAGLDGGFRVAAQGHVPFEHLGDELLDHVTAALKRCRVAIEAALRDNLVEQRLF